MSGDGSKFSTYSTNWKKLQETLKLAKPQSTERKFKVRKIHLHEKKVTLDKNRSNIIRHDVEASTSAVTAVNQTGERSGRKLLKTVALDCEFVGGGRFGVVNILARVSIVDESENVIYDVYVKPTQPVTDYRTSVSGIQAHHILSEKAKHFNLVHEEVQTIIRGKILVGHAVYNDLKVLRIHHPKKLTRDTSKYVLFQEIARSPTPSLKKLCQIILGISIQDREHDSICDAKMALQLYKLHKRSWESQQKKHRKAFKKVL